MAQRILKIEGNIWYEGGLRNLSKQLFPAPKFSPPPVVINNVELALLCMRPSQKRRAICMPKECAGLKTQVSYTVPHQPLWDVMCHHSPMTSGLLLLLLLLLGGGGRPWWLALLACGGAYWPLAFEPSAVTSRHPPSWVGIQNATCCCCWGGGGVVTN